MPLSQLPKSSGLVEMKKGYFPHLYNTEENNMLECRKCLTHFPNPSFYDIDNMHKEARDKFLQWYKIHREDPFDMDSQLLEYCHSDVDILLNACWKFRKLFMDFTGPRHPIDPFDYITIASLCMGTFHANFLPKEWVVLYKKDAQDKCIHRIWDCKCSWVKARKMHGDAPIEVYAGEGSWVEAEWENIATHQFVKSPIGIIPPHGYAKRDNYSMHAMEWILLEEKKLQEKSGNKGLRIQHVQSDNGEKKVPYRDKKSRRHHYHLDGYFVDQCGHDHDYEFYGCWYHSCPCCFSRNREALHVQGKSIQQRYIETIKKQEQL